MQQYRNGSEERLVFGNVYPWMVTYYPLVHSPVSEDGTYRTCVHYWGARLFGTLANFTQYRDWRHFKDDSGQQQWIEYVHGAGFHGICEESSGASSTQLPCVLHQDVKSRLYRIGTLWINETIITLTEEIGEFEFFPSPDVQSGRNTHSDRKEGYSPQ